MKNKRISFIAVLLLVAAALPGAVPVFAEGEAEGETAPPSPSMLETGVVYCIQDKKS
jgi:hypothetical protein